MAASSTAPSSQDQLEVAAVWCDELVGQVGGDGAPHHPQLQVFVPLEWGTGTWML